jgi:DNA-directed RNA polymerase specialized sigma24 family protein
MQITIDLPDEIAQHLSQSISNLPRRTLESLVAQAYRDELLTHAEIGRILNLSRWDVDSFLHQAKAYLHYDETDLEHDRATLAQLRHEPSQP